MEFTRRTAVLAGSAAVLAAGAPAALAAPFAWQARHGMNAGQYQATFDSLTSQGYRLVHVDGYAVGGSPQFAAIWNKTGGTAWVAHHNMTSAGYQQTFDQLGAQGYRLERVSGYESGGEALYAAIWSQRTGPAWQARHGMTGGQYQQTFDQLTGQGYRLVWVSGYGVAGEPRFAAIFEQSGGPPWMARHGLSASDYQAAFDSAGAQGYRLTHVCGYSTGGAPSFAAIWRKSAGQGWQARHNLTSGQYQATFDTLTQQGMRLVDVSGYEVGGQAMYAALWVNG